MSDLYNDSFPRDVHEGEVPPHVWEFSLWLREHESEWLKTHWHEVIEEAERRGITMHWDGTIEYQGDA